MESRATGVAAGDYQVARGWVPPWARKLGMPVWISDPDRYIIFVNGRAEGLLGQPTGSCVGRPCSEVIRGRTAKGKPFCAEQCPVIRQLDFQTEIEPFQLRIGAGRKAKWIQVVVIAAQAPDFSGPYVVHCVIDDEREQRFKQYLTKVMTRSPKPRLANNRMTGPSLTRREKEILALLSDDASLREIADKLHLSYTTVRNHVQHILNKLGVHSTMEAVAFYLLTDDRSL
jgi:DNA-binding CsgD family transcriptional regulator